MALYTQRRRRTRVRSAWVGGPPSTTVDASGGVATFGGGTVTFTEVVPLPVTSGVITFGGGTATFARTQTAAGGLVTYGGGVASVSVSVTLTATGGLTTFAGGTATVGETLTAASGLATFGGGIASVTVSVTLTATGGLATFQGGTATYGEARQSLLPGVKARAASGLALGHGRRTYRRRDRRRGWVGTTTVPPTELSAENGLATFAGGTASISEALTATNGQATFAGGTATVAVSLSAVGGVVTFSGDTATYSAGAPTTSLVPGRQARAAPGLSLGRRQHAVRPDRRRRWVGTVVVTTVELSAENGQATFAGGTATLAISAASFLVGAPRMRTPPGLGSGHRRGHVRPDRRRRWVGSKVVTTVDLTATGGLVTFAGGDATAAVSVASLLVGAPRMRTAPGLASGRAPSRRSLRGYRRKWVGTAGAPTVTVTLVASGMPLVVPPPLGDHWTQLEFKGGTASTDVVGGTLTVTAAAGVVSFTGGVASVVAPEPPVTHPATGGSFDEGATGGVFNETATGGTVTEPVRGGTVVTYIRGGVVREPLRSGVVDESVRAGADDSLTGGVFSETGTGGTVVTYVRGGTVQESVRGGVLPGTRAGVVDEPARSGDVDEPARSGDVDEPSRGGIYDEAATGGEVL